MRIVLVQAKTSPKFESKVIADLADNLVHIVDKKPLPYPASSDIDNLRGCLAAVYDNIAKFDGGRPRLHVFYATTGTQVAEMLRRKATSAERALLGSGLFDAVDVRCVTRDELREMYQRATQAVAATIEMPKKKLPLLKMPGVEESLLGMISARELVDKVLTDPTGNIRKALFHENVRDFQATTVSTPRSGTPFAMRMAIAGSRCSTTASPSSHANCVSSVTRCTSVTSRWSTVVRPATCSSTSGTG